MGGLGREGGEASVGVTPLRAHYPSRRVALASYRSMRGELSLFVPTPLPVAPGETVTVEVSFGDCAQTFALQGQVTWRRESARGLGQEQGLGIAFPPEQKFKAAKMLAFCAGRPVEAGTAGEQRFPTDVPCCVVVGERQLRGTIRDLSATGAFVNAPATLPRGTELAIHIRAGWLGLGQRELRARVVWTGAKNGVFGFGARFVEDAARMRPALRRYLKKAR